MIAPNQMLIAAAAVIGVSAAAAKDEPPHERAARLGAQRRERGPQSGHPSPPSTDLGSMPNLRFSLAGTHIRARQGVWSRKVTQRELPISTTMTDVNMRLNAGGQAHLKIDRAVLDGLAKDKRPAV